MRKFWSGIGRAAAYFAAFLVPQSVVSTVFLVTVALKAALGELMGGTTPDFQTVYDLLMNSVMQYSNLISLISGILTIVALFVIFAVKRGIIRRKSGMTVSTIRLLGRELSLNTVKPLSLLPVLIGTIGLAFFISFALGLLPEHMLEQYAKSSELVLSGNSALAIIATVIIAPIVEECIFRGLIYTRFKSGMPYIVALLLESLIFGLLHGQIVWICYAFVLGVCMTIVFDRYKSLFAPILMHMTFNLFGGYLIPLMIPEGSDMLGYIAIGAGLLVTAGMAIWAWRKTKGFAWPDAMFGGRFIGAPETVVPVQEDPETCEISGEGDDQ